MNSRTTSTFSSDLIPTFCHYGKFFRQLAGLILICSIFCSRSHATSCLDSVSSSSPRSVIKLFENLWDQAEYPATTALSKKQNDFYATQSLRFLTKLNSRIDEIRSLKMKRISSLLRSRVHHFQNLVEIFRLRGNLNTAQWTQFSFELVSLAEQIDLLEKSERPTARMEAWDKYAMRLLVKHRHKKTQLDQILFQGHSSLNSANPRSVMIPLDSPLSIRDLIEFVGSGFNPMGMIITEMRVDGDLMSPRTFSGHDVSGHSGHRPGRLESQSLTIWNQIKSWANHVEPETNSIRHVLLHSFSHESSVFKLALEGPIKPALDLKDFSLEFLMERLNKEEFWDESPLVSAKNLGEKVQAEVLKLQEFYSKITSTIK